MAEQESAIRPRRNENYPEWYQEVIKAADLAENSPVRGCMVIKPWGYGIWEGMQRDLDRRIKATGHENAYFPLFIPLSFLEKEASHVEGFAKECAVVTHHRLELKDGKLIPAAPLEEPLIVRPTSETIIGESFSRWVKSYRDLPLLINQWANVVRWEMRTRLFLRTTEFLWQEGHTAHATEQEAREEVALMLQVYQDFVQECLAIPVIPGEKTEGERFPGAVNTFSIEAMMQDKKALQAGTSHYLGQNFAKASNIRFLNSTGEMEHAYTTSWGVSTRMIGGLVMTHGDDDGLRVPPRVAPKHVVLLPVVPKPEMESKVFEACERIAGRLRGVLFAGYPLVVHTDKRDIRGGEKNWQWIKKGIPLRIEIGPRDVDSGQVVITRRDRPHKERVTVQEGQVEETVLKMLDEIQTSYYEQAKSFLSENIETGVSTFEDMKRYYADPEGGTGISGGFVRAKWCNESAEEAKLAPLKVTIRCLPLDQSRTEGKCVVTGKPATVDAIFAKAY